MSTFNDRACLLNMKRTLCIAAVVLMANPTGISAQETAAAGQAAPSLEPALAPPPDNAPAATPAATSAAPAAAAPVAPAANLNSHDVAQIRREAIIRLQEMIYRANESLKAARNAEVSQLYPESRKDYLFSAEAFGSVSRSTDSYATAAEGLTRVDFELYDAALKAADTARAKLLIEEILKYNPNSPLANQKLAEINRALNNPNDTGLLGNPAVTPRFVKKLDEVQQLFAEAEQFRRTGQWDEAEARLKRILGIDQYNIAASQALEKITAEKMQYDEQARLETREERLRQVEEKWYEPINNPDASGIAQEVQPAISRKTNFGLDQKLKNIFLSLDFNNATIEEATNFLSVESNRLDPDHKGVNFVIEPSASTSAKPVSITLNNVPLIEALRYVCQLANVKFKVQDYAISIVPFSQSTDDLVSKTFIVQPNFVAPPSAVGVIGSATTALLGGGGDRPVAATPPPDTNETGGDLVKQALLAKGLKFPAGASALYSPITGQLTVVDTADQMELLEELVNAGQAPTLMVRIATKFVEINQTDLNDLTLNSAFNFFSLLNPLLPQSPQNFETPSFSTALPGSSGFAPDSVQRLLSPSNVVPNTLSFRSFIDEAQLNVMLTALSQKKSTDLLSDPAVLTKSGERGILEAVRVFPYPISFDPPELVTQTNTGQLLAIAAFTPPTVIATTPTDFKRRNVGVKLVVQPQITADNKTIDLSLVPEVTEFEGFINYGSAIFVANPDGTSSLLSPNTIDQPVFDTRRITTKVLVRDGSTVVLGGLISNDVQNVNDKVPLLGDIPLLGRLFQSKAIQNIKKNLIIFVSANIYRNDGELLNPPEVSNTADILTGRAAPAAATP